SAVADDQFTGGQRRPPRVGVGRRKSQRASAERVELGEPAGAADRPRKRRIVSVGVEEATPRIQRDRARRAKTSTILQCAAIEGEATRSRPESGVSAHVERSGTEGPWRRCGRRASQCPGTAAG